VQPNDFILVRHTAMPKSRKDNVLFHDVLPNVESPERIRSEELELDPGIYLHRENSAFHLFFLLNGKWQIARVHHYSPKLMACGRRFVADIDHVAGNFHPKDSLESLPVRRISAQGKLIHITLGQRSAELGTDSIWLRPVLLDGNERYICYGATESND
jgi:hypothetical protein